MNSSSATVSFSVDRKLKNELDRIAALEGRSKSDIFRDMYRSYKFGRALDAIQTDTRLIAVRLGIETDDDVVDYIKGRGKFAKQDDRSEA